MKELWSWMLLRHLDMEAEQRKYFIELYCSYKDYKIITPSTVMRSNRSNINVLGITETWQRHILL